MAARAGLTGAVFASAGTSREDLGEPIDPRARRVLARAEYSSEGHRAHQITSAQVRAADLLARPAVPQPLA